MIMVLTRIRFFITPVLFVHHCGPKVGFGSGGDCCMLSCCSMSTEARWPVRDGDRVGMGRESEGSSAETVRKRPERCGPPPEQWKC